MLVENHPFIPSRRALNPGARMVFIKVCPVLKSLPQIGTPCCRARPVSAGTSTVKLGAPFANGTPLVIAAHAYRIEGAIAAWFPFIAATNVSGVAYTACGLRKISVDPHQITTVRETRFFFWNFLMSSLICSARSYFVRAFF